jgi:hypothetical protein
MHLWDLFQVRPTAFTSKRRRVDRPKRRSALTAQLVPVLVIFDGDERERATRDAVAGRSADPVGQ